jgi:hypothetical protein
MPDFCGPRPHARTVRTVTVTAILAVHRLTYEPAVRTVAVGGILQLTRQKRPLVVHFLWAPPFLKASKFQCQILGFRI